MTIPLWFSTVWALLAFAGGILAIVTLRTRLLNHWPSLFVLGVDTVVMYLATRWLDPVRYYTVFWANSYLFYAIQLWLAHDVLRSIPAIWLLSDKTKARMFVWSVLLGCGALVISRGVPHDEIRYQVFVACAVRLVWAVVVFCCVCFLVQEGFGHTPTGLRIGTGAIVTTLSQACMFVYVSTNPPAWLRLRVNGLDTCVGLAVVCYWIFAIANSKRSNAALLYELHQSLREQE